MRKHIAFSTALWHQSEFIDLSAEAKLLWIDALFYAHINRTNMFIHSEFAGKDAAEQLIQAKLWARHADGFEILNWQSHGYSFFKMSASQPNWPTHAYAAVYQRDGHACRYCGRANNLSIDHVIPRSQGGIHESENLVVACRSCNSKKGGRTPEQARMTLRPAPERAGA